MTKVLESKKQQAEKNINIINYNFVNFDKLAIYINSDTEFRQHMYNIANNFYIGIYMTNNVLHLVSERGKYYVIYTEKITPRSIEFLFNHDFVKKVCFNKENLRDIVNVNNVNIIELQFVFKILFLKEFNSEREMFDFLGIPNCNIGNISVKTYNFIEIAKKINIYIEKNKLNRYLYLEGYVKNILLEAGQRGFPINENKYEKFLSNLEEKYNNIAKNRLDFKNKNKLLENLNKKNKYLSLYSEILKKEDKELYDKLLVYNLFNKHKDTNYKKGNLFHVEYDTYNIYTLNIKENFAPNIYYYDDRKKDIIEGSYKELYFKILAELSRDKELILEASRGDLLEYIGKKIGIVREGEVKNSKIVINMFLEVYANDIYDKKDISRYIYDFWDTYIDSNDVENIDKLFYKKMPALMNFFKLFNGNDDEYSRYNSKIFHPNLNLHLYILQIENLIYKTAIDYIYKAINDFNKKYKKDTILIGGMFDKRIVLLADKKYSDTAIDILNRYMAKAYRRYIKNTKYFNATEIKKNKE